MSEQASNRPPDEPAIVWWPWWVLAAGPVLAAVLAALDDDPADGGEGGILTLVIVGSLALLFLAVIFAPALLLISRNVEAPRPSRERAASVFVLCVVGAHVVGQVIDRAADGESSAWGLAFIGTYLAASAISWVAMGRAYAEPVPDGR